MKTKISHKKWLPKSLFICIPFFYKKENLSYLNLTSKHYPSLAEKIYVTILTNTSKKKEIDSISRILKKHKLAFSIETPKLLGHPYLLPFSSVAIMQKAIKKNYSHFMMIEDDILFTKKNMIYWMASYSEMLKNNLNFYPSFVRVEKNCENKYVYSDFKTRFFKFLLPKILINKKLFINLPKAYQGLYLYDKKLMKEYLSSNACNPDFGKAQIREKANLGLSFYNVKKGFYSRNIHLLKNKNLDDSCFVFHLRSNASKRMFYKKYFFSTLKLIDSNGFITKAGTVLKEKLFY